MIADETLRKICPGLAKNKWLKSLILRDNSITNTAMVELLDSLIENHSITWLDFDRNNIHQRFMERIASIIEWNLQIAKHEKVPEMMKQIIGFNHEK